MTDDEASVPVDGETETQSAPVVRYTYATLSSARHFRLLRLKGSQQWKELTCSLHDFEIDLPDCPAFEAVSYTWDGEGPVHELQIIRSAVAVGHVQIRGNVFDLLTDLRGRTEEYWLWIDAICINQESVEERAQQVKLMGDIYTRAYAVIAWLHSERDEADLKDSVTHALELVTSFSSRTDGEHDVSDISRSDWMSFNHLCVTGYWERKWVVQELLLARTVIIMHGDQSYPITGLENFCAWLNGDEGLWGHRHGLHQSPMVQLALHRYHKRRSPEHSQSLHDLVLRYRRHHCSERADYVYALFNLIGEHRVHLGIDYTQTEAERLRATIEFLRDHDGLPPTQVLPVIYVLVWCIPMRGRDISYEHLRVPELPMPDAAGSILITAYDRGGVVALEESEQSLGLRTNGYALPSTPEISLTSRTPWNWLIGNREDHWELNTAPNTYPQPVHRLNSRVQPYFKLRGTSISGLTSARIKDGDRIWQFPHTRRALVVRKGSDGGAKILGLAILFRGQGRRDYKWLKLESERDMDAGDDGLRPQHIIMKCEGLPGLAGWVLEDDSYHTTDFWWHPDYDVFGFPENWEW